MATEIQFAEIASDAVSVKLYGKIIKDFAATFAAGKAPGALGSSKVVFAQIYCTSIAGQCLDISRPYIAILPDTAVPSDGLCSACSDPKEFLMWKLAMDDTIATMDYRAGAVKELVRPFIDVDASFGFQNVKLVGETVTGQIHAYLRLHQGGWLHFDWTVINATWNFTFDIKAGSITLNFGVASVTLQYQPPANLCGSVSVSVNLPLHLGHWSHTWSLGCIGI